MKRFRVATVLAGSTLLASCWLFDPGSDPRPEPSQGVEASSFDVVVQMTGLLLNVPARGARTAMHVLMPATDTLLPHLAFIMFPTDTPGQHCVAYEDGWCLVNMDGWALGPLGTGGSSPTPPAGVVNLTHGTGGARRVHPDFLGNGPGRKVRSRITFGRGSVTHECHLAVWRYDPTGPSQEVTIPIPNVVDWTISAIAQGSLVLTRSPLDPGRGDSPQRLGVLRRDPSGAPTKILVFHITPFEAIELFESAYIVNATGERRPLRSTTGGAAALTARLLGRSPHQESETERATHFHAFYDLLRAQQHERPLPVVAEEVRDECAMSVRNLAGAELRMGVRTNSCTTASAESGS